MARRPVVTRNYALFFVGIGLVILVFAYLTFHQADKARPLLDPLRHLAKDRASPNLVFTANKSVISLPKSSEKKTNQLYVKNTFDSDSNHRTVSGRRVSPSFGEKQTRLQEHFVHVLEKLVDIQKTYSIVTKADANEDLGLLRNPGLQICSKAGPNSVEDLLCMKPFQFLPEYKNPCWYPAKQPLRCLPYFQIIGVDKCGSTDLFKRIATHPDVLMNRGVIKKETMWWSWRRYGQFLNRKVKRQSFRTYPMFFSEAAKAIQKNVDKDGTHYLITGEGTPMDFWDFSGWPYIPQNTGLPTPKVLTPHLMRHINPNVRLIIIFRDPVERLYSDYLFLGLGNMSAVGFHRAVLESIDHLHFCTQKASLRVCLFSKYVHLEMKARLHLGFYSLFLKEWLKLFPVDQFLFLQTEEYSRNTESQMERVFRFLNLRELSPEEMTKVLNQARAHQTKRKKQVKPMLSETRRILHKLYDPFTLELAALLNNSKFSWNITAESKKLNVSP